MLAVMGHLYWPSHVVALLLLISFVAAEAHNGTFDSDISSRRKELSLVARIPFQPPANPRQEYDAAVPKGIERMRWFHGPPGEPPFRKSDLPDNGWWVSDEPPPGEYELVLPQSMRHVYDLLKLGLLPPGPTWYAKQNRAGHTERAYGGRLAGTPYSATEAKYHNAIAPQAGVITSLDNKSPQAMKQEKPSLEVPPLSQMSDVVALTWAAAKRRGDPQDLRWWFRFNVRGGNTKFIMMHICALKGTHRPPRWPGWTFSTNEEEGFALLGSRHGSAIAYALAQYGKVWLRNELGKKKSKSGGESDPPKDSRAPINIYLFSTDETNNDQGIHYDAWNLGFEIKERKELPPISGSASQGDVPPSCADDPHVGPGEGEAGPSNLSGSTADDLEMADSGDTPDNSNHDEEMTDV